MSGIYCGNHLDIMKGIEDNNVDLTITSPPYDNLRDYQGYDFNFEELAKELFRVTKQGGVVVWVVGDATIKGSETGTSFRQALYFKEIGFNLHDTMIYEKHNFSMPQVNRYHQLFEYMFILSKGKPTTFNPIKDRKNKYAVHTTYGENRKQGKNGLISWKCKVYEEFGMRANIWKFITTGSFPKQRKIKHPAKFPEQLANDHILTWSNENDLVLDPMCGSGTTCKMAKLNNRNYIGIDISEEYCDVAIKRIKEENG